MGGNSVPVGARFMEPVPELGITGEYDPEKKMWIGEDGVPNLIAGRTVTGSNASTGPWPEQDYGDEDGD